MDYVFSYHPSWLFLVISIALLGAFLLYYNTKVWIDLSKKWIWLLAAFRFISLFFIGMLLLGIILKKLDNQRQKPIAFILHDQSESIVQTKDSTFYRSGFLRDLERLKKQLDSKFEVVASGFSENILSNIDSNYSYKVTNISNTINQIYDQYANQNIGAIILSSDGIYNSGQNPIYTISRKPNLPIFSVGLGDTTVSKDILISGIVNNDIAFLGNDFPVEINLLQNGYSNQKVKIEIHENGKLIQSKNVMFEEGQSDISVYFQFKAEAIGYRKYTATVSQLDGEFTYKNNIQNFYINVIDGRQKILLTYSYIHPDIAALNFVIKNNKNYDLTVKPISEVSEDLSAFDLIIVHNYQKQSNKLDDLIASNEVPFLHIVGVNADFQSISRFNIGLNGNGGNSEDIVFEGNVNFKEIIFNQSIFSLLSNAPPLKAPQGNISFSEGIQTIAFQKIGNIALSKPLIYSSQKQDNKYAVILGEGLWRWRLYDQLQNKTTKNFEEFFSQIITYLAIKENKDPFKINLEKEYEESDQIIVRSELYNASYQLTNDTEVKYKLIDEEGKVFDYVFFKTNDSYILELGRLKQGVYEWQATTRLENENYMKSGRFVVKEVKKELLNLSANHRLLKNLSMNTNGSFYLPKDLGQLKDDLLKREDIVSITYQEKSFIDIIDYKWIFILILLLLVSEWFIRKFHGGY